MCVCSTLAIPGEVLLACGEVYRVGLCKEGTGSEFIAFLKDMPATRTTDSAAELGYAGYAGGLTGWIALPYQSGHNAAG